MTDALLAAYGTADREASPAARVPPAATPAPIVLDAELRPGPSVLVYDGTIAVPVADLLRPIARLYRVARVVRSAGEEWYCLPDCPHTPSPRREPGCSSP